MRIVATLAILAVSVFATACGPDCQSSCQKLYGSISNGDCNLPTPGSSAEDRTESCMDECVYAINRPGNIGSFDPSTPSSGTVAVLENEQQAALWMDCIAVADCTRISDGQCQPH